jgi:hypothetical protein
MTRLGNIWRRISTDVLVLWAGPQPVATIAVHIASEAVSLGNHEGLEHVLTSQLLQHRSGAQKIGPTPNEATPHHTTLEL